MRAAMAVVHVSEAEAVSNFATLLQQVRDGLEVVIDDGEVEVARIVPPSNFELEEDPADEAMILARIEQSLDDPRPPLESEAVEAYFAKRRQASRMEGLRRAG